jgi:hypothetical protein
MTVSWVIWSRSDRGCDLENEPRLHSGQPPGDTQRSWRRDVVPSFRAPLRRRLV